MKKITLLCLIGFFTSAMIPVDFLTSQLQFQRVRVAKAQKGSKVTTMLSSNDIDKNAFNLFIRGIKDEQKLEVWAKNKSENSYKLINTYDFCATTGELGPKRRSGDKQMPEGFYKVDRFNPESAYYLSFRINYPNESDLHFADKLNPGDNIFIHGDCITIGCIPIGDENIKELYLLAAMAKDSGPVNVHIFPTRMDKGMETISKGASGDLKKFWSSLTPGYTSFEKNKTLPNVSVGSDGYYLVK
ncbi:L,D-transpeptidase catalytic domain [Spirosomataceae bacterium TFI 002]|nr:L,D-transpeptidase catalytic domain [Spirosomataceae bacterium TFI 002]